MITGCFSIPGYVHSDGSITPPYSKEVFIEALSGNVTIYQVETSKGIKNIDPLKSDTMTSHHGEYFFLSENNSCNYNLEGNHSVIFAFRTMDEEATFRIIFKRKVTDYVIHNSDFTDKLIYIENY